ncbi:MAG: phage portal protein [Sphingomonas sp.]|uniref:phage portal protein n=1 Tax=Sphingomonas sp. TaxID=28214 RepID=UPI0018396E40|nr:phage portal protein [Sphingomonas sp.]MBA3667769.1 phage portal protein [Sphingomonas sp.]
MGWFGRKGAPADARPFVPVWLRGEGGEAGGFARGYEAQYEEVFRLNPVGQRAVRLVAGMLGSLTFYADAGREDAVRLLGRNALIERIGAALLLHGNAYVQLLTDGRERPAELHLLRSERVTVTTDAAGWPAGLVYRVGTTATRLALRDPMGRRQVAHLKALNPGDDHYGLGCLDAAIAPASVHNRAAKWNKALLDNAARPSGALVYEPGDGSELSGAQFDRLKAELAEMFSGSANAGRPLLLDGGLKWQALSLTPSDMDFAALKDGAARDIALAFGVPPVLVGLPGDATYANAREAGRALYRRTILPMAGRILAGLNELLGDWVGAIEIRIDEDAISELAEDRARLWEQVGAAEFLSRDEKRVQLGFEVEGRG